MRTRRAAHLQCHGSAVRLHRQSEAKEPTTSAFSVDRRGDCVQDRRACLEFESIAICDRDHTDGSAGQPRKQLSGPRIEFTRLQRANDWKLTHRCSGSLPGAIAEISRQSPFQLPQFTQRGATSSAEVLTAFEQGIGKARDMLRTMDDAALAKTWKAVDGDREEFALPVGGLLRSIMLNHWYHHRGQLSVYLRQVAAQLPSIYGPSADENPFLARREASVSV